MSIRLDSSTFISASLYIEGNICFIFQIHDGKNSAAHNIGRFCGSKLPKGGNIITTTNLVYIWFRSDTKLSKDGFALNWTTIDPGERFHSYYLSI